jgi:ribonuclease inhibitor
LEVDLDGREISSKEEFHSVIGKAMNFGPYYGGNLDALWDSLTRNSERPIRLMWRHASVSRVALGEEYFGKIINMFSDVANEDKELGYVDKFEFQLID